MFPFIDSYIAWWILFIEVMAYSFATSALLLLFMISVVLGVRVCVPISVHQNYKAATVLFFPFCLLVGLFAYVLGIMSSLSRDTGNPAIISALIPALGVAILYFKEKSVTLIIAYVVLTLIFVVNIFSGTHFGAALRVWSTESVDALSAQAERESKIRQYRKNLDLPLERKTDKRK